MEEAKGGLEERVARIEGILSQMNERLNPPRVEIHPALLCRDHELGDDHRRTLSCHLQRLSLSPPLTCGLA
jgi:hypothetical protein